VSSRHSSTLNTSNESEIDVVHAEADCQNEARRRESLGERPADGLSGTQAKHSTGDIAMHNQD
jgi:hypothetical protein